MNSKRLGAGNTLTLVVVVIFALLVVGYIVLNYTQLLTTHKEAQTAIDAASIAAAKDMSHIVIDEKDGCHFGVVALVDDVPRKKDNRPVLGVNTLMATVRLDAIIANKLGSSTMLVLAAHDLQRVQADCLTLRKKIAKAVQELSFVDKDGNRIDLQSDVNNTFDANAIRLGGAKRVGNVTVSVGWYSSPEGLTNIPVPQPESVAQVTGQTSAQAGGTTVYKGMVDAPLSFSANGSQGQFKFKFIPVGDSVSLISSSNCEFLDPAKVSSWPGFIPPYLFKAEASQDVAAGASLKSPSKTNQDGVIQKQRMTSAAIAICGGLRQTFGTGSLIVSVPGGPPPQGQGPNCTSIQTIMNSSQIRLSSVPAEINSQNATIRGANVLGTASAYTPVWNKLSPGDWQVATGGPVPANGSATLSTSNYRLRSSDDPSVVLSHCVYDWLHAMYLRPNVDEVVGRISANLGLYSGQTTSWNNDGGSGFIPAAYASSSPKYPVSFGMFDVPSDGMGDPRDLRNFAKVPEGYRRQIPNLFGYVPAEMTLPDQSLVVAMNAESDMVTTNGQPISTLTDFYLAMTKTNEVATSTFKAAQAVGDRKVREAKAAEKAMENAKKENNQALYLQKHQELYEALKKIDRAYSAERNAYYIIEVSLGMLNDRKALSGLGITKLDDKKFEMIGGYFLPITHAASEAAILGTGPVETGQDSMVKSRDWCARLKDDKIQVDVFQSMHETTSNNLPEGESGHAFMPPVHAATTLPQALNNIFTLKVVGNVANSNSEGKVAVTRASTTSFGSNIIAGQLMYQNTASLIIKHAGRAESKWNTVARDNGANYSGETAFFGNPSDPGYNIISASGDNPPIVAEWSLRCPTTTPGSGCTDPKAISLPVEDGRNLAFSTARMLAANVGAGDLRGLIEPVVDAAGNVTYYWRKEGVESSKMHFFGDVGSWSEVMQKAKGGTLKDIGGVTQAGSIGGMQRGGTQWDASVKIADLFKSPQALEDWYLNGTDPISRDEIPGSLTAAEKTAMRNSIYSNMIFYTVDENSCAHLFVWSS